MVDMSPALEPEEPTSPFPVPRSPIAARRQSSTTVVRPDAPRRMSSSVAARDGRRSSTSTPHPDAPRRQSTSRPALEPREPTLRGVSLVHDACGRRPWSTKRWTIWILGSGSGSVCHRRRVFHHASCRVALSMTHVDVGSGVLDSAADISTTSTRSTTSFRSCSSATSRPPRLRRLSCARATVCERQGTRRERVNERSGGCEVARTRAYGVLSARVERVWSRAR